MVLNLFVDRRQMKAGLSLLENPLKGDKLEGEIANWRKRQVKLLPAMKDFIDDAALSADPKDAVLFLPSDLDEQKRKEYGLEEIASCERTLREGEATDAIIALQQASRRAFRLGKENKHMKKRETNATRRSTIVNNAKQIQKFWMDEYCIIREKLLALGMASDDPRFRELTVKDVFRPDFLKAPELGQGSVTSGWIWQVHLGKTAEEPADWEYEGKQPIP